MADAVVKLVQQRAVVTLGGGELVALRAAQAALPYAERAEAALAEIEEIASGSPDAPSILNKANKTLDNVLTADFGAKALIPSGGDTEVALSKILTLRPESVGAVAYDLTEAASTANVAAFVKAANDGLKLDGNRRLFAISGRLNITTPGQIVDLQNMAFEQIATTGTDRNRTIVLEGLDNVRLRNITIDLGGIEASSGVGFGNAYGLHLKNCTNVYLENVRVINGCGHTGILIEDCESVEALRCEVRDFVAFSATEPVDDLCQGLSILNCTDVDIQLCGAVNLTANWPGRPVDNWRRWSRGVVLSGVTYFRLVAPYAEKVDQGIDITGQDNHAGIVADFCTWECTTFGLKIANRGNHIRVLGGLAYRSGWSNVVVSSQLAGDITAQSRNVTISNVTAIDAGWNGLYDAADSRNNYQIISTNFAGTEGYPAGVEFIDCASYDLQAVRTVDVHYAVRGSPATWAPSSSIPRNKLRRCRYYAAAGGGTFQTGFGFPFVKAKGSGNQSVGHGADAVLIFDTDINDPSNRNDTSNGRIYADERGLHCISAIVEITANATGRRELVAALNGTVIAESRIRVVADASGTNQRMLFTFYLVLAEGDYVDLRGYQNTGSNLVFSLATSYISVTKVADA